MLKPLGDRVVLKLEEEQEKTVGGLVLAGTSQEKTKKAQVLAVGQGNRTFNGDLVAPSVTVGDRVLVDSFAGVSVKEAEQDLVIVHESDILAIID